MSNIEQTSIWQNDHNVQWNKNTFITIIIFWIIKCKIINLLKMIQIIQTVALKTFEIYSS